MGSSGGLLGESLSRMTVNEDLARVSTADLQPGDYVPAFPQ